MLENISKGDNLLLLLLSILACYRLAQFVAFDDAPFGLMRRFRLFFGKRANKPDGFWHSMAELINCPYCVGLWLALIPAFFFSNFLLYWLAIAGGQTFLESLSQSRGE